MHEFVTLKLHNLTENMNFTLFEIPSVFTFLGVSTQSQYLLTFDVELFCIKWNSKSFEKDCSRNNHVEV